MESNKFNTVLGLLRLSMGLIFLWAFFDKLLGLGFATTPDKSWLSGGSPTTGFLQNAVHGPFANFYHSLAGSGLVDWTFMIGLLSIGAALTLGIKVKINTFLGAFLLFLMYTAIGLPPENHPFIDEHFIYVLVMLLLMVSDSGKYFGFGIAWAQTSFVQKYPILK